MIQIKPKYRADEFRGLIRREGDSIELKTGVSLAKLQEAFVAFSNTEGGVVFIGVNDARVVVGRKLDQGTDDKIHEAALAAHSVGRYEIREILVDGNQVIAVSVKRREEGFAQTSDGRILIRKGARNIALLGAELSDFMSRRSLRRFERAASELLTADADPRLLQEVCLIHGWDSEDENLEARLQERGLATSTHLTIAGALFLTRPADSLNLRKASVEVRRYTDEGTDYDRREVFDGALHEQVRDASKFVVDELGSDLVVTGLYRHELPRLPEVVVRETIANAVAHRTYEIDRTAVLVEIRPDFVVIRSPGSLPEPVTISTIRQAQAARNPDVIDVLRHFSLAEDAGRGVDVIQDEMEEALLDPPTFQDDGSFVTVRLPLSGPITSRERAWVSELERTGKIKPTDRLLLVHAARGESLTNASARLSLRTDDRSLARQSLHRLRDAGLLDQHGKRGGAAYTLTDAIAPPAVFRLSLRELGDLVVEAATKEPLSNASVRLLTGLNRQAALSLLQSLVRQRRLRQTGERRGTTYTATKRQ
jgi:ATP-dependent DNA helicase RecG